MSEQIAILAESSEDFIQKMTSLSRSNIQTFSLPMKDAKDLYHSLQNLFSKHSAHVVLLEWHKEEMHSLYYMRGNPEPAPEPRLYRYKISDFGKGTFLFSPFTDDGKCAIVFKNQPQHATHTLLGVKVRSNDSPMMVKSYCCDEKNTQLMFQM